ncbi:MAG TPA: SDR family NAD(P)-dependent oxidoreductase [Iamia sp.]|jgi:short-subunit dehydrogenase|nr:SDR family NAD(P)-dependent oxidoreductase [Iamia sp.]
MDTTSTRPLAVITGASTGIGLGIARALVAEGHDLVIAADEPAIHVVATELGAGAGGPEVQPVEVDLATRDGVAALADAVRAHGRPADVVVLNAGIGVDGPFVDTPIEAHLRLLEVNVVGAVHLAGLLLPAMAARGEGRLLVTSSIASAMTGPLLSTYNASKTFLAAWADAVREELAEQGVTVTTLMPGGTDTEFFARADMEDTRLGRAEKDDPDEVGREAVATLLAGERQLVSGGVKNKVLATASKVLPDSVIGAAHERFVEKS